MSSLFDTAGRFFRDGGLVMYPIALLSIATLALSFERLLFWRRAGIVRGASAAAGAASRRARWLEKLNSALRRGDFTAAAALCRNNSTLYAWYVEELLDAGVSEAAAMEIVERMRPRVERSSITLSAIVTAAPMLGILGTVSGLIQSFGMLGPANKAGSSDPTAVAGGIAEALHNTAFGLAVALAALFPCVWSRGTADAFYNRIESLTACALEGQKKLAAARDLSPTLATDSFAAPPVGPTSSTATTAPGQIADRETAAGTSGATASGGGGGGGGGGGAGGAGGGSRRVGAATGATGV